MEAGLAEPFAALVEVTDLSSPPRPSAARRSMQAEVTDLSALRRPSARPSLGEAPSGAPPVAAPFVKWAGGKRRLAATILAAAPPVFGRYLEPFVGGGALALLLAGSGRPLLLNDANDELMSAYRAVRDDLPALLAQLDAHARAHCAGHFYRVRSAVPAHLTPVERAARLIYLNKTCFNGLYRVNRAGFFNVPLGRYAHPALYDAGNLRAVAAALAGSQLFCEDYRTFLRHQARPGDFIYLDPPYAPAGPSADFKRYTSAQFRQRDQIELAALYDELVALGAYPVLSNSHTPLALALYAGHHIQVIEVRRSINHDGAGRGPVREILVTPRAPAAAAEAAP